MKKKTVEWKKSFEEVMNKLKAMVMKAIVKGTRDHLPVRGPADTQQCWEITELPTNNV